MLPAVPSTNVALARLAREGAPHGLVLATDHQTAGRGRLGREWHTPPRVALTFSVLVRPSRGESRHWSWLPLLTGLAVVEAVDEVGGPRCVLKWPNDVLHEGRKLGGLLAEVVETPAGPAAVLGVGVNVSTRPDELPVPTATSLAAAGPPPDRAGLLRAVLGRLGALYLRWEAEPERAEGWMAHRYAERCDTLGRRVRAELPGREPLEGVATGLDASGALLVRTTTGLRAVNAGDVVHLRAADGVG